MTKIQSIRNRVASLVKQAQEDKNPPMGDTLGLSDGALLDALGTITLGSTLFGRGGLLRGGVDGSVTGNRLWSQSPWLRKKFQGLQDWHDYMQQAPERARGIVRTEVYPKSGKSHIDDNGAVTYNGSAPETDVTRLAHLSEDYTHTPRGLYKEHDITPFQLNQIKEWRRNLGKYMDAELALKRLETPNGQHGFPPEYRARDITPSDIQYLRDRVFGYPGGVLDEVGNAYRAFKLQSKAQPDIGWHSLNDYNSALGPGTETGAKVYDIVDRISKATRPNPKFSRGADVQAPLLNQNGEPIMAGINPVKKINVQVPAENTGSSVVSKLFRRPQKTVSKSIDLADDVTGGVNPVIGRTHLKTRSPMATIGRTAGGGAAAGLMYLLGQAARHHNQGTASKATSDD